MTRSSTIPFGSSPVLAIAEIKDAVGAFDRGEANAFDVLDAIMVAVDAYRAAVADASGRPDARRDAA